MKHINRRIMQYQVIVLDLDGTLTNSKKEITEPTRQALIDIQKNGKTVVLASGRPINGVAPLAKQLRLQDFGGYMLSFNGARVTRCSDGKIIYNKQIPPEMIRPICDIVRSYAEQGVDLITYTDTTIISAIAPNQYTRIESGINRMEIYQPDDFVSYIDFPINKLLVPGPADVLQELMKLLKEKYHGLLNIIGLTADSMICCGDGFNDLSMIEYAGLGVAMENAQPIIKDSADFITRSNDEDGVLHVVNLFMR